MVYHLDFETRSRCDLKKCGAYRYANDPSTEILCMAIAEDGKEPWIWTKYDPDFMTMHSGYVGNLLCKVSQPGNLIYAHNAPFERAISDALWEKTTGFKPPHYSQWRCTAAMGRRAALPASLEKLAEVLKLGHQKDPKGKALIRKFSIPQTVGKRKGEFIQPEEEPEAFKEFCDYCIQDVKVEQEIHRVLKDFEMDGTPLETFIMDMEINGRGFPVNLDALHKALGIVENESGRLTEEFRALTGCSPNQNAVFLAWLKARGYEGDNLQAETLEETLEDEDFDPTTEVGQALQLKKMISYASLKKIPAMINCAGPHDNRVRGTLTFHGAGPGRWSATLVQPQNFKRPTIDETEDVYDAICAGCDAEWLREMFGPPLEMVSSSIRHFIHDTANGDMLDADYAAIEARVIAWQAQEEWRLDVFRTHGKIYEASASQMFHVPLQDFDNYKKTNGKHHPLRQKGKTAELACIAEGQLVETDYGLVPIEHVAPYMLIYDGKEFVKHAGVVYQGIKEVITYEGLTATPDHIVFTEDGTCQFGDAARSKKNLLQSKPSRKNLRFCGNHISRKTLSQRQVEGRIRPSEMHELQTRIMDIRRESYEWEEQRMLSVQPAATSSFVAIEARGSDGAAMQQCEGSRVPQLWRSRDSIQIRLCFRGGNMDHDQSRSAQTHGVRQDRQQRALRTKEFKICHQDNTAAEPKRLQSYATHGGMGKDAEPLSVQYDAAIIAPRLEYRGYTTFSQKGSSGEAKELAHHREESRKVRTYDILNCGPRNRFVVSGVIVHNCGYRGGPGAMERMGALKEGLTKKELPAIVKAWREASPNIVKLWDETEAAAVQAVRTPNVKIPFGVRCHFVCTRTAGMNYLFMVLPSGRRIAYPDPKIEQVLIWGVKKTAKDENGDEVEEVIWFKILNPTVEQILQTREKHSNVRVKDGLTIFSQLPKTVHWGRVLTHGGILVENCVQGIAFDFMAEGALNASKAGYEICALIHDEALSAYHPEKGQSLEEFVALLTKLPAWADGMPLKAEGDVVKFYKK